MSDATLLPEFANCWNNALKLLKDFWGKYSRPYPEVNRRNLREFFDQILYMTHNMPKSVNSTLQQVGKLFFKMIGTEYNPDQFPDSAFSEMSQKSLWILMREIRHILSEFRNNWNSRIVICSEDLKNVNSIVVKTNEFQLTVYATEPVIHMSLRHNVVLTHSTEQDWLFDIQVKSMNTLLFIVFMMDVMTAVNEFLRG